MLRSAHPAVAANVIGSCSPEHSARLLAFMTTDRRVAILGAMDEKDRRALEAALPPDQKEDATRILAYAESAVARLMTPKIWRCARSLTAAEAMADLRDHRDQIEVAQNCYVVDGDKLVGVAALREIAIASPETRLEDLMVRDPIAVSEETEKGDAAEIIRTHDFLSLPVITKEGGSSARCGWTTSSTPRSPGSAPASQPGRRLEAASRPRCLIFQTSLFKVVRSRITWLILLFVAETATGTVLRSFEDELAKVVALSFFIPLLIGTGGNAGSQNRLDGDPRARARGGAHERRAPGAREGGIDWPPPSASCSAVSPSVARCSGALATTWPGAWESRCSWSAPGPTRWAR